MGEIKGPFKAVLSTPSNDPRSRGYREAWGPPVTDGNGHLVCSVDTYPGSREDDVRVAQEIADALNARDPEPDEVGADLIDHAARTHECEKCAEGQKPEPTVIWTVRWEAVAVEDDGGDLWEHDGRYWCYERPEPTTVLMFPCGQIVPLDDVHATPGQKGADLGDDEEDDFDREELALLRAERKARSAFIAANRAADGLTLDEGAFELAVERAKAARVARDAATDALCAYYAAHPEVRLAMPVETADRQFRTT